MTIIIDSLVAGATETKAEREEFDNWYDAQPKCGACGNLLTQCHIGPCPWGLEREPVWDEQREDWV